MNLVCYSDDGVRSVGSHGARSGALGTRNQYAVGAKTELSDCSSKLLFKCDKGIFLREENRAPFIGTGEPAERQYVCYCEALLLQLQFYACHPTLLNENLHVPSTNIFGRSEIYGHQTLCY